MKYIEKLVYYGYKLSYEEYAGRMCYVLRSPHLYHYSPFAASSLKELEEVLREKSQNDY